MKINWLYVGIGAVVLYVVYRYMMNPEEKAFAGGEEPCTCQGQFIGMMSPRKCERMCRKANNFNF